MKVRQNVKSNYLFYNLIHGMNRYMSQIAEKLIKPAIQDRHS